MRTLADALRNKWKSAVIVLASTEDGAVSIVAGVTKDLTQKIQAGKLVGTLAQAVGGKGGGRPDMAEGGGKDPAALPQALAASRGRGREQTVSDLPAFDAIVIGAGPTGLACGLELKRRGLERDGRSTRAASSTRSTTTRRT